MASQSKTVKFEVGQLVKFSGHRVGQVSKIAKNGSVYVIVLGEATVEDQTREELRVKKADMQLISDVLGRPGGAVSINDYVRHVIRNNISCDVSSNAEMTDDGVYKLAPEHIPSPGCLEYCEWEGSAYAARVRDLVGLDLSKLANLYTGKSKVEGVDTPQDTPQDTLPVIEEPAEPVQSALSLESAEAWAEATYALRELTFSVTRHSILTAFIDVALNKNIPDYHHQVAGNLKNLMAAAFDHVHDASGYARINTWTMAALELVVKNKDRVAKMLNQPIEAAPIKLDRVTKLGLWIDNMMRSKGIQVNDMTSADDSCYVYVAIGKKLHACTFVVVEVSQAMEVLPLQQEFYEHLTAQSAIAVRKQYIDHWRQLEPGLSSYCGIVPVYKTEGAIKEAVEDMLASVIK